MTTNVNQTPLPGVGVRYDFITKIGDHVGLVHHHTNRFDLLIYDKADPDSCTVALHIEEEDGHILAEIMGSTRIAKPLNEVQELIPGLTIDWIPLGASWHSDGLTLNDLALRAEADVSIVAVVRNDETIPSPDANFRLYSGDIAVVVGTPESIQTAFSILQGNLQSSLQGE